MTENEKLATAQEFAGARSYCVKQMHLVQMHTAYMHAYIHANIHTYIHKVLMCPKWNDLEYEFKLVCNEI